MLGRVRRVPALALACAVLLSPAPGAAAKGRTEIAEPVPGEGPLVVRVYYGDAARIPELSEYDLWEYRDREHGYVLVSVDAAEYAALSAAWDVEIDRERTEEVRRPRAARGPGGSGINGFPCYRTVEETEHAAEQIAGDYPLLASWLDVGDTWEKQQGLGGYDLHVLKLTNKSIGGAKPKLVVTSSIHAREYAPAELSLRFAEYLVEAYGVDADATWLLDHHEVHLMLHANPDGRKQAEGGALWRKNTNTSYCGATSPDRGADLNRNFDHGWACCGGASDSPCSEVYRGPFATSEPEVQAIQTYLRAEFPDVRGPNPTDAAPLDASGIYLDNHSFGELVLWPWGYTATVAPNGTQLQTLGRKLAFFNGYVPQQAIELYPTDGTTDDFGYGELGVASYTFEVGTSFFQNCASFESRILPDNLQSLLYAAKAARAPYRLPAGPEPVAVAGSPAFVQPGQPVTIVATLDDTRFAGGNGTEPTQTVASAELFLDVVPWDASSPVPLAMAASDGAFDAGSEPVEAALDTTGLAGRHTVYVRGTDSDGNEGVVGAAFFWVADGSEATVSGTVLDESQGQPLAATVSVDALGLGVQTAADGSYALTLPVGTWTLRATSPGFVEATVPGIVIAPQTDVVQNVLLAPIPSLLVVDDDDNSPDVRATYTDALDALGEDYLVWDTGNGDDEPDAGALAAFDRVIWFSGDEFGGAAGPGAPAEGALAGWLDRSACLWIASQDYHYDRGLTPLLSGWFGAQSVADDVGQSNAMGQGLYAGFGPYFLNYPYTDYADDVVPDGTAAIAFTGSTGTAAAISKETPLYLTTFWSFGLEAVGTATERSALVQHFLDRCDVLAAQDGDGDGVANGDDCLAGDAGSWGLPSPARALVVEEALGGTFSWAPPLAPGATGVTYDLLAAASASGFATGACVATDTAATGAVDATLPAPGGVLYYLVRARNACGATLGSASTGASRAGLACN